MKNFWKNTKVLVTGASGFKGLGKEGIMSKLLKNFFPSWTLMFIFQLLARPGPTVSSNKCL